MQEGGEEVKSTWLCRCGWTGAGTSRVKCRHDFALRVIQCPHCMRRVLPEDSMRFIGKVIALAPSLVSADWRGFGPRGYGRASFTKFITRKKEGGA